MRSFAHSAFLSACFMLVTSLAAQNGIVVRPHDEELIVAQPGQIVTTTFRIQNADAETSEFLVSATLPRGWRTITEELPFSLNKNQSDVRIFSFLVPAYAPAGEYVINYAVESREYPELRDSQNIRVVVQAYGKVLLDLVDAPDYAFAGDTVRAVFHLENKSNQPNRFALRCKNAILLGDSTRSLQAGGSATISTVYFSPSKPEAGFEQTVVLSARFCDKDDPPVQQSVRIKIIPRTESKRHSHFLPGIARAYYFYYEKDLHRTSGMQGDVTAKGFLDKDKKHYVDLRLRGPDQYSVSVLGRHDEYFCGYAYSGFTLEAGDQAYSLSTLTELHKYGRGVLARYEDKAINAGIFFQKSRWYFPSIQEQGLYFDYGFLSAYRMRLNYLRKQKEGKTDAQLGSVELFAQPLANARLELEGSVGKTGESSSGAYRILLKTRGRSTNFYGYYIHAGDGYPGYYQNTSMGSANLDIKLLENLYLDLCYRRDYQNADIDTTLYSAPFSRLFQTGLSYRLGNSRTLNLMVRNRYEKDRFPVPKFDYVEQSLRLQLAQTVSRLSMNFIGESGRSDNLLEGFKDEWQRMFYAAASMDYRLAKKSQAGGYISYSDHKRYSGQRLRDILLGINGKLCAGEHTTISISYRNGYSLEEYYRDRNILEAGANYVFAGGKELDLRCRYTLLRNTTDERELALSLNVSLPFNLPLPAKNGHGSLQGNVMHLGDGKIEGIILHLGEHSAVTDAQGRFVFPNVVPGLYELHLDPRSIALHDVILEEPLRVDIRANEAAELQLTLCRASSIRGRISYADSVKRIPTELPEMSSVIIEAKNERGLFRVLCNAKGEFYLPDLTPGTFTLTAYERGLDGFSILENERIVALKPGEVKEIRFIVVEKKRTIQFKQSWHSVTEKAR
jgi:hypothetical protein